MDFSRSPIFPSWSLHKMTSRIPCLISALRIPVSPPVTGATMWSMLEGRATNCWQRHMQHVSIRKHAPWENPKLNIFCCGFLKCNLPIISSRYEFCKNDPILFFKTNSAGNYPPRHHLQQTQWLCCPMNSLAFVLCVPWLVFNSNILSLNFIKAVLYF